MTKIEISTIVMIILAVIAGAVYIGRLEGRIDAIDPPKVEQRINEGLSQVNSVKESLETTLNAVRKHINEQNIHLLVTVECGKEYPNIQVPIEGTKTDDWLVFGTNLSVTSQIEKIETAFDNAIFAFSIDIISNGEKDAWSIKYNATTNVATGRGNKESSKKGRSPLHACGAGLSPLEIFAIRANQKIAR